MIWQTPAACEPEGVLGSLGACWVQCQLPTSPSLVGRAVGMLSPAGPGGWRRVRGGVYQIHLFPAGRCSSSLLPLLPALCCSFLPRCPRHRQVSSPVGDGCDNIPGWLWLFLRGSLMGHSVPGTETRHGIMFEKECKFPIRNAHLLRCWVCCLLL